MFPPVMLPLCSLKRPLMSKIVADQMDTRLEMMKRDRKPTCSLVFRCRVVEPLPRAIATISIAAVAVVLGDVSATAGASSAATSQTPVTQILRGGEALLNR